MKDRNDRFSFLGRFVSTSLSTTSGSSKTLARHKAWALASMLMFMMGFSVWGQAPGLMWSTNVGATLIGSDAQTNLYAEPFDGESIITLNSAGVPLHTNHFCPFPAAARRDAAGNFYFAGTISSPVNFGNGTIISNNLCAIAKYDSAGNIMWARGFGWGPGFIHNSLGVNDLEVDPSGVAYVTWSGRYGSDQHAAWELQMFSDTTNAMYDLPNAGENELQFAGVDARVTVTSPTSGYAITVDDGTLSTRVQLSSFTSNGFSVLANWFYPQHVFATANLSPIDDGAGNVYNAEYTTLTKRTSSSGALTWSVNTGDGTLRCVANDLYSGVHVADDNGLLARYDSAGNLAWTTNLPSHCNAMICDSQGNRFISRNDGVISRLLPETILAPAITIAPQGGTVFAGTNFTFNVSAAGFSPFVYYWLYQSNALAASSLITGASTGSLTLSNVTANQSGLYSVIVSNVAGSVTSAPVTLNVKAVELYSGSQMLSGGNYSFGAPPTLSIQSAFPSGQVYYTLDGSTPSFLSTPYAGPFVLTNSATINAIGYSSDFSQSALADTVVATVPAQYTLSASTPGGGSISLSPPGGSYTNTTILYGSNTIVTATAVPAAGYSFLCWQGASTSTSPTINVTMNQNETLSAVFGTTLSTSAAGNGRVLRYPPSGLYAYGSVVRLEALPGAGSFFGAWGNAASGSANPLYFTVTNPTPSVSSVFATVPTNQAALTVLIFGKGKISANPSGNVFATNQSVTLTATPDAGQTFIKWGGSVNSTQNPLTVGMSQSQVVMASFSGQSVSLSMAGSLSGLSSDGFRFTVVGDPQSVYQIQSSTNITHTNWQNFGLVTNTTGQTIFIDHSATNAPSTFYRAILVAP